MVYTDPWQYSPQTGLQRAMALKWVLLASYMSCSYLTKPKMTEDVKVMTRSESGNLEVEETFEYSSRKNCFCAQTHAFAYAHGSLERLQKVANVTSCEWNLCINYCLVLGDGRKHGILKRLIMSENCNCVCCVVAYLITVGRMSPYKLS